MSPVQIRAAAPFISSVLLFFVGFYVMGIGKLFAFWVVLGFKRSLTVNSGYCVLSLGIEMKGLEVMTM